MAKNTDNRVAGLIVAGIVGALAAGALALATITGASAGLDDAAALRATDLAVATQDLAMSALSQSVQLAEDAELGTATRDDVALAAAAGVAAITAAEVQFAELPESLQTRLSAQFQTWGELAQQTADYASQGSAAPAADAITQQLAGVAAELGDALLEARDEYAAAVAAADSGLGVSARLVGFLVVFVLPLAAIVVYRFAARRRLEAAAAQLDARISAESLTTRSRDTSVVDLADEMKVPLDSIREFSSLLLEGDHRDRAHIEQMLGLINGRAEDLLARVEDLGVAATGGTAPPETASSPLEMSGQIDAVVAGFTRRGHVIGGTYGSGIVVGDETRIRQILRNLIGNAVAHGGPDVRIYGDVAGSRYVVSVEDNGPGLSDELVQQFAVDRVDLSAGSAMGLGVARVLAKAMGGEVVYERVAGRTAFVLSLPAGDTTSADPHDDDVLTTAEV